MHKSVLLLVIVLSISAHAQPDTLWAGFYGGRHVQYLYSAQQTMDGGFIMGGTTYDRNAKSNYFIVKAGVNGDSLWSIDWGGERHDKGRGVCELSNGGYVIVGEKNSYEIGSYIGSATKFSRDGDSLWTRYYGGEESDYLRDVVATDDGGFIAAGYTSSFGNGTNNAWVVKADSDGEIEWQNIYGGGGADFFRSIISTADGGYAAAGFSNSYGGGRSDHFLVKIDSEGNEEWHTTYEGEGREECYSVIQTSDGGYALGGVLDEVGSTWWLVKTDANGELEWDHRHYAGGVIFSLLQTSDIGYVMGGRGYQGDEFGTFNCIRVDSVGEEQWSFHSDDREDGDCFEVLQMDDGGYAFAGWSQHGNLQQDFRLFRTEPDPLIVPRFIDPSYPSDFIVEAAYPNPFNGVVTIPYRIPVSGKVRITVYDSFSRELELLVDDFKPSGCHQITWVPESLPSGTYMVSVGLANSVSMVPVMLVK